MMRKLSNFALFYLAISINSLLAAADGISERTTFMTLEEKVARKYIDKCSLATTSRPVAFFNETIPVSITMLPLSFRDLADKEQT